MLYATTIYSIGNQQIAQTTKYRSVENLIFKTINVLICSEIHRRHELIYGLYVTEVSTVSL